MVAGSLRWRALLCGGQILEVTKGCCDRYMQALQFEGGTHIVSSGALATLSGAPPDARMEPLHACACTCTVCVRAVQASGRVSQRLHACK